MAMDYTIPPESEDVCLVCKEAIPQNWATYVRVVKGVVRRTHLDCGDKRNVRNAKRRARYAESKPNG